MRENLLIIIIAIMAFMTIVEMLYSHHKNLKLYNFQEFMSGLVMGLGQQVVNFCFTGIYFALYASLFQNFKLFTIDATSVWSWVLIVFVCDLAFYIGHSAGHRVNIFIAGHTPHHQAEVYNFGSAFRQSWSGNLMMSLFYLPLAFIGFPLEMFMVGQLAIMFVQFFAHSGLVQRELGWFEYIFVTPMAHRGHHCINRPHLDTNHGGVFIIWDRLFGTYQRLDSKDKQVLGVQGKFNHNMPNYSNRVHFKKLFFVAKHLKGLKKVAIFFQTPEKLTQLLRELKYNEKHSYLSAQQRPTLTKFDQWLNIILSALLAIGVFSLLHFGKDLGVWQRIFWTSLILWSVKVFDFTLTQSVSEKINYLVSIFLHTNSKIQK